ncbi:hypothetical protein QCA50_014952 [Cerrena zonata]|uniref:Uncharacterized protein n=1 Tax=Cerrena zonata TaxID=2478898 RepID=A0AAW0FLH4_9APHY
MSNAFFAELNTTSTHEMKGLYECQGLDVVYFSNEKGFWTNANNTDAIGSGLSGGTNPEGSPSTPALSDSNSSSLSLSELEDDGLETNQSLSSLEDVESLLYHFEHLSTRLEGGYISLKDSLLLSAIVPKEQLPADTLTAPSSGEQEGNIERTHVNVSPDQSLKTERRGVEGVAWATPLMSVVALPPCEEDTFSWLKLAMFA